MLTAERTFTVQIARVVTQTATVEVEAENAGQARNLAIAQAKDAEWGEMRVEELSIVGVEGDERN